MPIIESKEAPIKQDLKKAAVWSSRAVLDGVSFSGESWTNWGKNLKAQPKATWYPNKLEDLRVILREAKANNKKIRCVGTSHSWSGGAVTKDYMVSINNMNKIHPPEKINQGWTVMIESGVTISELDQVLKAHNPPLALPSNVQLTEVSKTVLMKC